MAKVLRQAETIIAHSRRAVFSVSAVVAMSAGDGLNVASPIMTLGLLIPSSNNNMLYINVLYDRLQTGCIQQRGRACDGTARNEEQGRAARSDTGQHLAAKYGAGAAA
jgi:hypothetical protein